MALRAESPHVIGTISTRPTASLMALGYTSMATSAGGVLVDVVVVVPAPRLRQATADHVSDGQEADVERGFLGAEVAGLVRHHGREDDSDDSDDVRDQFGGLERCL